jgi:hypothetical protein
MGRWWSYQIIDCVYLILSILFILSELLIVIATLLAAARGPCSLGGSNVALDGTCHPHIT